MAWENSTENMKQILTEFVLQDNYLSAGTAV